MDIKYENNMIKYKNELCLSAVYLSPSCFSPLDFSKTTPSI
uniref:Uncharacterized protein n=1 Tax=viral metagenome TaxID=1070528 RepID=A0A6C0KT46_9ZZZZ